MTMINKPKDVYAKLDEANGVWRVVCVTRDGASVVLGNTPTEKGAKRMVTVHKKFYGLV